MEKHYKQPQILASNQGNNAFNFDERTKLIGKAILTIPSLKTINTIDQIQLGDKIVFEEIDHTGAVRRCTGLSHIYKLNTNGSKPTCIIMDNHNHALYFRGTYYFAKHSQPLPVIHIDQHADLAQPAEAFERKKCVDFDYLRDYTNYHCHVGSFIIPALDAGYITDCVQVRTGEKLTKTADAYAQGKSEPYILDIDCDFRVGTTSGKYFEQTIQATRVLIEGASLITVATSPYFMNQYDALEVINKLFS